MRRWLIIITLTASPVLLAQETALERSVRFLWQTYESVARQVAAHEGRIRELEARNAELEAALAELERELVALRRE